MALATQICRRIEELGAISDVPGQLTRLFGGHGMRAATHAVATWMEQAGMTVRRDAIGNLIGRHPGAGPKTLLLGSHLDTVRNAGKFDGVLGVLLAIACVERCREWNRPLPFSIEVIAFSEEEGVRYQTAYLGSRAMAGTFDVRDLDRLDADGVMMGDAILVSGGNPAHLDSCRLNKDSLLGYVEAHIEQGPVLDRHQEAIGLVSAIAGQTRARLDFISGAGHAGTVPMTLRRDALCAAAEFILGVEMHARQIPGLVATVGQISVEPNAANVIPGTARLSLDVRHQDDGARKDACKHFHRLIESIAIRRQLKCSWNIVQETASVPCAAGLSAVLEKAALQHQPEVRWLASGAGHDAAVMAAIAPVAMLFVCCRDGLSHHPDEYVREEDIRIALSVLVDFIMMLAERHEM